MVPIISIVIPAFNEQESLPILCERLDDVLQNFSSNYEIIIVDDGSRDSTWSVLEKLHQDNPSILGIRLSRNFGHQNALLAGIHAARGHAVITMDADLQHPPETIPKLLKYWQKGYKIVNTVRLSTERESAPKRLTSRLFYRVFSWITGSSIKRGMADFRLLDREVIEILKQFHEPHIFLRGLIQWMGFRTAEVGFIAPSRQSGQSKYSWRAMFRLALVGITSFSILPLRLSILIGMVTALLAFCELFYVLVVALVYKTSLPGWASTLGVISFLFGILFVILGMVGEYIGRIFEVVKSRPLFIVEKRLDLSNEGTLDPPKVGRTHSHD